jgi:hypothetical protein
MDTCIATILPELGSGTPDKTGSGHQKPHEPTLNNTLLAATWANKVSTPSVRLAMGFRTPLVGLPMAVAEAAGDFAYLK